MDFDIPVSITNDVERRVAECFSVFDVIGNRTVDNRDIGSILRFLGCVPTERDIHNIILATEFEEARGVVHLSRFLPHVCRLILERKMEPAPAEKLLEAFQVLDPAGNGYLTKEVFSKMMTEEGEPLTAKELEDLMLIAVDPQTGLINYEFYLNKIAVESQESIYKLAAKVEADRIAAIPVPKTFGDFMKSVSL